MHLEIPECKRCCLCLPLRHGILIFGYLNLAFSLLLLSLELVFDNTADTVIMYRGVGFLTQMWLPFVLFSGEVIFNVILVVGAHTKRVRLIRWYYYYGIMTTVAACLCYVAVRATSQPQIFYFDILDFSLVFSSFAIHVYLLLLIRTELQKLKYREGQLSYINHMSEVLLETPPVSDGRNPL